MIPPQQTQARMLQFSLALQAQLEQRFPVTQLIVTHLLEALVFVPIMVGVEAGPGGLEGWRAGGLESVAR